MGGGTARLLYERFPQGRVLLRSGAQHALGLTLLLMPFVSWATGFGVLDSRLANLLVAGLAGASLYYGWRLAEPPLRGAQDAHFGQTGDYR